METSLKTGFAQIFSCCPKNLSCPKFGGAAAPLAPPARTPMPNIAEFFFSLARLIEGLERHLSSASYDSSEFLFRRLDEYKRTREVKSQLAEIQITNLKHNLLRKDRHAVKELQQNTGARHRHHQAVKGITTVDMNLTCF